MWQGRRAGALVHPRRPDVDHDGDEVDLTGLMESIVDSDEEEDLAESIDVMIHFPPPLLLIVCLMPFVTLD